MRHQYVSRETAIVCDAKMMMRRAHVFFAGTTGRAGAAADPRIDRDFTPENDAVGAITGGFDHSGDLVSKRERQSAVFGDVEPLIAAQGEIAVLDMQIRVANPAARHPDQNLGTARYRTIDLQTGPGKRNIFQIGNTTAGPAIRVFPLDIDQVGAQHPEFNSPVYHVFEISVFRDGSFSCNALEKIALRGL